MAEVSIANVRKVYGSTEVIHDLSVKVNDGEFVVLVGPSGCGKSTLLRMVAGLESITAGEISIGGKIVNNLPPSERDIAMVFQNYALYPHKTVEANMAFSLKMRKLEKIVIKDKISNTNEGKCLIKVFFILKWKNCAEIINPAINKDGMKINVGNQIPITSKVDNVILLAPTKFLVRSLKPKLLNSLRTLWNLNIQT